MEIFSHYGLGGMFASAFLAATVLPLSSEVVLGVLLAHGLDPLGVIGAATLGNVLGAAVNYGLGLAGSSFLLKKIFRLSPKEIDPALDRFKKYGAACLIFSWVPFIGDPLTFAAGMLKIRFRLFLVLVFLGKLGRYLVLSWAVLSF
ncbi:YqaA family protein [Desulfospira joergensenii]|uniref:YqaA family protein n=1 Tax=Desulfospira joergensenii TaxID=53329 RepID=UPI0003B40B19|nr:YqaA family protein [Desulfospira joergensenii]